MSSGDPFDGAELVAMAFCWRIARRDGVVIGLTSHDRALSVAGLVYDPAPGLVPSAIERDGRFGSPEMEIEGAITSGAISTADIDAGRWDGAAFSLHLTDWTTPGVPWIRLIAGSLGTIERREGRYTVALRSRTADADRPFVPETSPSCRARFGDRMCSVDLAQHRSAIVILGSDGVSLTYAGAAPKSAGTGSLRWLTGRNAGLETAILSMTGTVITLARAPRYPAQINDRALMTGGCDKRIATCHDIFGNVANFRGEAMLPGNDLLLRYPDAK